jgi:iron complex outermembrane receptor protein
MRCRRRQLQFSTRIDTHRSRKIRVAKDRLCIHDKQQKRGNQVKRKPLTLSIIGLLIPAIGLSIAAISTARAQVQPGNTSAAPAPAGTAAPESSELPTIEVTGSLIRTTDLVNFNQVQVVTDKDIEASGAVTVADFLRDTAENSASSWADDFAYGATGGAGIALRGLSEKYTLVLVDGQRVAPYGFPSNGTDTFADLNSIPLNIIDRIEIVKTGAVSQYGSDAIAGVVNIITKKNYNGLEVTAGYGDATQGGEATRKFGLIGGFGDLDTDRYNVTASASYFLQNGYTLAGRSNTRAQDYSNLPYGAVTKGSDYWEPNGVGNGGAALSPCPPSASSINASSLLSGPGTGSACAVDTADGLSLHPHEERLAGKIHATFKLSDEIEAFADLWDSRNTTIAREGYNGINDSTTAYKYNPFTGGITQVSNVVPASNPYNPYGAATPLTYTFLGEPAVLTVTSNFYRAASGLQGSFKTATLGTWNWATSLSHSQSTVDNSDNGVESVSGLTNILDNGVFDLADPSATPNGLAGLYDDDHSEAISKLDTIDASASTTDLFRLPAGDVGFGAGAQFLHESDFVTDYALQSNALAVPFYLQAIDGQRNVAAAYYQVNVPIVSTLAFTQSSRYDHYSDFGSAFSPRFALRFKPVVELTTYASYSRGFRAPTLAETSQKNSSGVQSAVDPYSPTQPTAQLNYPVLVGGNPNLQPEKTQNYNIGFEWSAHSSTTFGLDWYKIAIKDVIGTGNIQTIIDANDPAVVVRNPNGTIAYVNFDYQNLNALTTEGFEANFRQSLPSTVGTFTFSGNWAYVWNFDQTSSGTTVDFAGNDGAIDTPYGASFPRWKGNTNIGWSFAKSNTVITYQFTGPYVLTQESGRVPSYSQFNLTESYSPFKDWTVYALVSNILDRRPPYDPLWLEFPTATPYDPSLYSDEGRYIEIGAKYRFR